MGPVNDADILDIVRRLRQFTNALDNVHLLSGKIPMLHDAQLTAMAERTCTVVDDAAAQAANLLKYVENSPAYRDIVKKFKAPLAGDHSEDDS